MAASDADLALLLGCPAEGIPMVLFNAAKFVWLEYNDEKPWDHLLDSIGALCGFPTDRGNRSNATWRDVARRGGVEEDLMTGHVLGGTTVDPEGNGVIMPFLRWKLGLILARTGILHAYDRFVITRCDYFFECNLDVRKLDKRSIWVPFGEDWGGMCDRFVVLPRKFALLALSLIEDVVLHPEDFIGHCKAENRPPPPSFL